MARFITRSSRKAGLPPGSVLHIGEVSQAEVKIRLVDYTETELREDEAASIEECFPFKETPTVTWINIDGLHRVEIIEALGEHFGLHPLVLEDIVHTGQRPKMEDYEGTLFILMKMLRYDDERNEIDDEQVSILLGANWVISLQERPGDVFDPLRERIRHGKGKIRSMGPDYLAYSLIDAIVDNYFIILEKLADRVETLDEKLVADPSPDELREIHSLKRELLFLRKSVWPLREVISALQRGDSSLFEARTLIYLRDVYDHTIQVIDTVETLRDTISGMLDIYLSSVSNRMNEVMKVLTIIATIFIPLTFVAGIYGMNFTNMPETKWSFGYFWALSIMALVAGAMIMYFRRKKWF